MISLALERWSTVDLMALGQQVTALRVVIRFVYTVLFWF